MKEKYTSKEAREAQREKQRQIWTSEKKIEQSRIIKQYFVNNPEDNRWKKACKPCVLEINDKIMHFSSLKELKEYLRNNYGFCCSRKIEQDMLHHKTTYYSTRTKYSHLNGMKMYYVV